MMREILITKIGFENFPAVELLDTLEALWKVAEAAKDYLSVSDTGYLDSRKLREALAALESSDKSPVEMDGKE